MPWNKEDAQAERIAQNEANQKAQDAFGAPEVVVVEKIVEVPAKPKAAPKAKKPAPKPAAEEDYSK